MRATSSVVVFALALGAMFVLLYFSMYMEAERKDRLIEELQWRRAEASISRMIEPENICFAADDQAVIEKYPSLLQSIREADQAAQLDERSGTRYGNYYSGTGAGLDKASMLSMIETYSGFNRTVSHVSDINKLFTYESQYFSCGFSYSGKYYRLGFTFTALEEISRDVGYVPVHITEAFAQRAGSLSFPSSAATKAAITYAPFNNTAVFFNELSSPVTVEVARKDTGFSQAVTLPPGRMQDVRLAPDWNNLGETAYHYKVREHPEIEGGISVSPRYNVECMSREVARSLYLQTGFAVKFPSYLPQGFSLGCIAENLDTYVIQIYANQTASDYHRAKGVMHSPGNPYPFYLYGSMPKEEVAGIVQVHAQKYYFGNAREQAYAAYQQMLNNTAGFGYTSNPQFFEADGGSISYFTYNEGQSLSVVIVANAKDNESYRVVGALPMDEMIKIAKSLV
jgi:hypothetical protein